MVRLLIASLVVALAASAARADKLADARAAIEDVRYDRARTLLLEALREGSHPPRAMAELYRLSASTAIVLGDRELGEQYYRRWLALEPDATLPDDVAPKFKEAFAAAQAHMAAHGRLAVKARRAPSGVDVVVESDPLAMAVAASSGGARAPISEKAAHLAGAGDQVAILDEHGNRLLEIQVAAADGRPMPRGTAASLPRLRRWTTWAIPAAVFLGTGIGFGIAANAAQADLDRAILDSPDNFFEVAENARMRRDAFGLVANLSYAASALCAVTAVVTFATRPKPRAVVTPTAARGAVGLSIATVW